MQEYYQIHYYLVQWDPIGINKQSSVERGMYLN